MQDFKRPLDRRRKPDIVIRLVHMISLAGWTLVIISSFLTINAKPEQTNMFYKIFNVPVRAYWNTTLLGDVFVLLIFLFVLSLVGILLNATRQRRKTDKLNKSLIFQAFMAALGMVLLWINSVI